MKQTNWMIGWCRMAGCLLAISSLSLLGAWYLGVPIDSAHILAGLGLILCGGYIGIGMLASELTEVHSPQTMVESSTSELPPLEGLQTSDL